MSYHSRLSAELSEMSVAQLVQRARELLHACREDLERHNHEAWEQHYAEHKAVMDELWERV